MKKRKIALYFNIGALVFYVAAAGCLFAPFIWQIQEISKGRIMGGSNNGIEVGMNFGSFPSNIPNFLALLFIIGGLVSSIIFLIARFIKLGKKNSEEEAELHNARMLTMMIIYGIVCGFLPFLFCTLTLTSYGIANVEGYYIGEGAPLSAIFSLLGGICLYYAESGLLD